MFLNYNKSTRIRISNPCECRLIPLSFFYNNLLSVDLHFKKSRIFAVGINPFNLHFNHRKCTCDHVFQCNPGNVIKIQMIA